MTQVTETTPLLRTDTVQTGQVERQHTGGNAQKAYSCMETVKNAARYIPLSLTAFAAGISSIPTAFTTFAAGFGVGLASAPLGLTIGGACALILGAGKLGLQYAADHATTLQSVALLSDQQVQAGKRALPQPLKDMLEQITPEATRNRLYSAMLKGAHVTIEYSGPAPDIAQWGGKSRYSSHYNGKEQFGMNLPTPPGGHLLYGKTATPEKIFVQFEKHGTGLTQVLPHLVDWGAHKFLTPKAIQVGPLGCIGFSEKNGSEIKITVDQTGKPTIQ